MLLRYCRFPVCRRRKSSDSVVNLSKCLLGLWRHVGHFVARIRTDAGDRRDSPFPDTKCLARDIQETDRSWRRPDTLHRSHLHAGRAATALFRKLEDLPRKRRNDWTKMDSGDSSCMLALNQIDSQISCAITLTSIQT